MPGSTSSRILALLILVAVLTATLAFQFLSLAHAVAVVGYLLVAFVLLRLFGLIPP